MTESSYPLAALAPVTVEDLAAHLVWARRLAAALVHDRQEADDAVQEAWIAGWKKPPAADRPVRPWLVSVVINRMRNRARAERRRTRREETAHDVNPPDPVPTPEELTARLELQRRLAEHFLRLPDLYRHVMYLRFYEGLDSTAIGLRLSLPPGTVRWRIKAGLEQLRAALDGEHGGERKRWLRLLVPLAGAARRTRPLLLRPLVALPLAVAVLLGLGFVEYRRRTGILTREHLDRVAQMEEVAPRLPPPLAGPPVPAVAAMVVAPASCPEADSLREETARLRAELQPHLRPDTILASAAPNPALERHFGALIGASIEKVGKCGHRLECRGDACRLTLLVPLSLRDEAKCLDPDLQSRFGDYVVGTSGSSAEPVWDPVSRLPLARVQLRYRLASPDAAPIPRAQQPRRPPLTILRHQIRPSLAANTSAECRAAYRQALAERAALEKIADRDLRAGTAFDSNAPNPPATIEARRHVEKVLGADVAARLAVECRGPVCRVDRRSADDPLTAIRWDCHRPGYCLAASDESGWFRRLAPHQEVSPFWVLDGSPTKTPTGETPPHYRVTPAEDRDKPDGMVVLRQFTDPIKKAGLFQSCEHRFPATGRLALTVRLTEIDSEGRSHIEVLVGDELGGSPLAACIARGIEEARSTFEIPAHAGGAVINAKLDFPGARQGRGR